VRICTSFASLSVNRITKLCVIYDQRVAAKKVRKTGIKPLHGAKFALQLSSRASSGVEFSTGSFWPMANSEFVEALANRTH